MTTRILIIGAGPAGVSTVETFRQFDRRSQVVMLSAEPYPPYSPPAMVEHYLTGSQAHFWRPPDWSERMQVDYRPGLRVSGVDPPNHQVILENGERLEYDRLVIATGSRLYAPLPGADLPGVANFKSLSAAEALIARVKSGQARRAVIVGAGFIGMEIALLLSALGVQVIQVEMMNQVMPAMLDTDTAAYAQREMQKRGVQVRLNTPARRFIGTARAEGVELESGEVLTADILVAATGVQPNLDFLQEGQLARRWGLTVDAYLRTSDPAIYAAGDVAETPDRLTGEAYVHAIFPNAVEQGRIVGLNLAGIPTPYAGAERMNSLKHLGLPILAVGLKQGDQILQSRYDGGFRSLYLQDDRLVGFQLVGDLHAAGALHTLLLQGRRLNGLKDHLLSPTFGQGTLVWQAAMPV